MTNRTLSLPRKHTADWLARYEGASEAEGGVEVLSRSTRTIALALSDAALTDLISDALFYAHEMGPDATGDGRDYRASARALLRAMERAGVTYSHRDYAVMLTAPTNA